MTSPMHGIGSIRILVEAVFLLLLFYCGYQDAKKRRVRNWSIALLSAFSLLALVGYGSFEWRNIVLWSVLTVTEYILYALHYVGAGDVKVISASSLFGFVFYGPAFVVSLVLVWLLDWLWLERFGFRKRGSGVQGSEEEAAPLVWLWAWACSLFILVAHAFQFTA